MYYLLFRANTKWVVKGAKAPVTMDLAFVQDFTVSYNDSENIGLLPTEDPKQMNRGGLLAALVDSQEFALLRCRGIAGVGWSTA